MFAFDPVVFVSLFSQISAVRLPREPSNPDRLKGFGYAEFEDLDSLLSALSLNEEVEKLRVGMRRAGKRAQLLERGPGFSSQPHMAARSQPSVTPRPDAFLRQT